MSDRIETIIADGDPEDIEAVEKMMEKIANEVRNHRSRFAYVNLNYGFSVFMKQIREDYVYEITIVDLIEDSVKRASTADELKMDVLEIMARRKAGVYRELSKIREVIESWKDRR